MDIPINRPRLFPVHYSIYVCCLNPQQVGRCSHAAVEIWLISRSNNGMIHLLGGEAMPRSQGVLEYKCPCCGAGLVFGEGEQKMQCAYCDNAFDIEAIQEYNESLNQMESSQVEFDDHQAEAWSAEDQVQMQVYSCPSCGGELITDGNTAATFCPFCENPAILRNRLSGGLKPQMVIPFQTSKADAQKAFLSLCQGKRLLPKFFMEQHRIEKITGIYVPFWLYSCNGTVQADYRATRIHSWTDSRYRYTKTDHYLLRRTGTANFTNIPIDGSRKMDDAIMESIEPFHFDQMLPFDTAYLSGFYADKYDVDAEEGKQRIQQRVDSTMNSLIQPSLTGFISVVPGNRRSHIAQSSAQYVLLPVWMLHTRYQDKTYVFAMNGQTGKMTGTFPICPKRSAGWFLGISAAAAVVTAVIQLLVL